MLFQLCTRDEYGQTSITDTCEDINKLVIKAKANVSNDNMENALTRDEQKKNFNSCFVEVVGKDGKTLPDVYYAGKRGNGTDYVYILSKDKKTVEEKNLVGSDYTLRFYIGESMVDKKNNILEIYFALTPKGKEVDKFNAQELEGKTISFIRKVR